jgi:hypothetical protein
VGQNVSNTRDITLATMSETGSTSLPDLGNQANPSGSGPHNAE